MNAAGEYDRKELWLANIAQSERIQSAVDLLAESDTQLRLNAIKACERNPMLDANVWVNLGDQTFMYLDLRERVSKQIFAAKGYEHDLTSFIISYLNEDDTFIDVGAHFGYFSIIASKIVGQNGQVYSFEPVPYTFGRLMTNVAARPNITPQQLAAWSTVEQKQIVYLGPQLSAFSSFFTPRLAETEFVDAAQLIDVECVSLDLFCQRHEIRPKLVKIDAENAELEIIRGMASIVEICAPAITVEVGDGDQSSEQPTSRRVLQELMHMGYELFNPTAEGLLPHEILLSERYRYGNVVAIMPTHGRGFGKSRKSGKTEMRNKVKALDTLYAKAFSPRLCVDIGAGEGTEGLYESGRAWTVIMVEPSPSYLPALHRLADQMGSTTILHAVAGATTGEVELGMSPEEGFFVSLEAKPADWQTIRLPQFTVDEIVSASGVQPGFMETLLKIDVDGTELEVLMGAESTIKQGVVVVIEAVLLDAENSRFHRLIEWFSQRNYSVVDIVEPMYREIDEMLWQVDLIVAPACNGFRDRLNKFRS
jgi:FkbM family methyltransferase